MRSVGIFTTFTSPDSAYSLCNVVEDQIKMLLMAEIKPVVFVQESGWWKNEENVNKTVYKDVDLRFIPAVACHNQVKIDPTFHEDVGKIFKELSLGSKDLDVIITHDIIYQPAALKHNVAARKLADIRPDIKWLHWIHSATSPFTLNTELKIFQDAYIENVRTKFPNSRYVFFNHYSIRRIAENFQIKESDVSIVHHPTDIYQMMRFDKDMTQFSEDNKLLEKDFICVYPCRLDGGKQVQYMIKTVASLKRMGKKVAVIVVDFHSTGGPKLDYRDFLRKTGNEWGLGEDLIFTSEYKPEWKGSIPRRYVSMLFQLSNLFMMVSATESYSLVAQEAALLGNILVANENFPPFRDILGPHVIWREYHSQINKTTGLDGTTDPNYHNEEMYHMETAMMIMAEAEKSIEFQQKNRVRQTRNLQYILTNELLPLIY